MFDFSPSLLFYFDVMEYIECVILYINFMLRCICIVLLFSADAVRRNHPDTEDIRVEKAITAFFIGARDRCGGRRARKSEPSYNVIYPSDLI